MRIVLRSVPFIFFLISFVWMLRALLLPGYPDLKVHYFGAQHLIERENPYIDDEKYFTSQVYPPFDIVFFIPLVIFPFVVAQKIWICLSIAAILGSVILINRVFNKPFFNPLSLFLTSLVFIAFPTKFTLGMGQINAVILFLTTLVWYFFSKKAYVKSGIILGFPLMLKFFPLLFLPYFLYLRKWSLLVSCIAMLCVLFLLSLFFIPFDVQFNYFTNVLPELLASWKGDYYNQSLTGVLMRSTQDKFIWQILRGGLVLFFLLLTFGAIFLYKKKTQGILNVEIALIMTLSLLINNFSWQHHFIQLVLPFYILVYTIKEYKEYYYLYIVLALSYALIAINFVAPSSVPSLFQNHVFFGGCILYFTNLFFLFKLGKKSA